MPFPNVVDMASLPPGLGFLLSGGYWGARDAGDFNGDGYDDLILVDFQAGTAGVGYLIPGKAGGFTDLDLRALSSADGFTLTGPMPNYSIGGGLAVLDFNGDGFDDLALQVSEPIPHDGTRGSGMVYVVFGRADGLEDVELASFGVSDGFRIIGATEGDWLGHSIAGADLNGDGFDDLILASNHAPDGRSFTSTLYVFLGHQSGFADIDLLNPSPGADFVILGASNKALPSVHAAGDVNGDGIADLMFSSPSVDGVFSSNVGALYVVFGKTSGFGTIDVAAFSASDGFRVIGHESGAVGEIDAAGDVNGDGFDDLVIGAPTNAADGLFSAGYVHVVFGKASGFGEIDLGTLTPEQGFRLDGLAVVDRLGQSIAAAGDINGDGYGDLIVSAPQHDPEGRDDAGVAYVIFGRASSFASLDLANLGANDGFEVIAAASGDRLGPVNGAGDVNNDGFDDVLVFTGHAFGDGVAGLDALVLGRATGDINRVGGAGNDLLRGGEFNDTFAGAGGDDTLVGRDGADTLRGGAGADTLDGGGGVDTADYSASAPAGVFVQLAWQWARDGWGDEDILTAMENIAGSALDDVLIGFTGASAITGGGGNDWIEDVGDGADVLSGEAGNDIVWGAAGDDALAGDDGDDALLGGAGNDTLGGGAGVDWIYAGLGADIVTGGDGDDVLFGAEGGGPFANDDLADTISGGAGADALIGEGGNDLPNGEDGDDWAYGGAGNDTITGGAGNDVLAGEDGDDVITGGDGDDFLFGGYGNDTLNGGAGSDWIEASFGGTIVIGGAGADSLFGGDGAHFTYLDVSDSTEAAADVIGLFWRGDGVDRIDVSAIDADGNAANGVTDFLFVGAFTNVAGQAVITWDAPGNRSIARFDVNGDGASDMSIVVLGVQLVASDFIL